MYSYYLSSRVGVVTGMRRKTTPREIIQSKNNYLSGSTDCREILSTTLGKGSFLLNTIIGYPYYMNISVDSMDALSDELIFTLNNMYIPNEEMAIEYPMLANDGNKLIFLKAYQFGIPDISSLAFILNYFGNGFKLKDLHDYTLDVMYDPEDYGIEYGDDAILTMFYVNHMNLLRHHIGGTMSCNGPASYLFYCLTPYLRQFKDFCLKYEDGIHSCIGEYGTDLNSIFNFIGLGDF